MNAPSMRPNPSVLLVDDDDFLREIMCEMLMQLGVTNIHQAGDGLKALSLLQELPVPPDFLICDIYMPDMDGIEFVGELAKLHYRGGVLLLSGVNPETLQLARDIANGEGIQLVGAYLKPIHPELLADALGLTPAA
jgi:CheY-like chemotaxis protein